MKVLVYSAHPFIVPYLERANNGQHQLKFIEEPLDCQSVIKAVGHKAISIFFGDDASLLILEKLKDFGVRYIALRSTGHDNVNLRSAERLGIRIANVPSYSPNAIAEHAIALLMTLNRKLIESHRRIQHYNFKVDGLIGFDLKGKKVGIVGTGKIGSVMAKIMNGFGCKLLGYDIKENGRLKELFGLKYTSLEKLCSSSDIITIHTPLTTETHHLIDKELIAQMKKKVVIVNTARGAVVNSEDMLLALQEGKIAGLATDVYERERGIFFNDHSASVIKDETLKKLIGMPNVLITSHQAFLTHEALTNIAKTTIENIGHWQKGTISPNEIFAQQLKTII